jgi:hypothetical protein
MGQQMTATEVRGRCADLYGFTPDLGAYSFLPSANGALTGIFVDGSGQQIGASIDWGFTSAQAFDFAAASPNGALPANAVGFVGQFSHTCNMGLGNNLATPIAADANCPVVPATTNLAFGRVSPAICNPIT